MGPTIHPGMRQRLQDVLDHFCDVRMCTDDEIALRIKEAEIDILVDLHGFTMGGRKRNFRPSTGAIQVNYLGCPGTVGADYIDYIIADRT